MRELILKEIKQAIKDGDEELVENFGKFNEIKEFNDKDLLDCYTFLVSFRG